MSISLESGHLFDDRIYCPSHQTSFSIKDGYPDTGTVQDKLNTFEAWEENGKMYVLVPEALPKHHVNLTISKRDQFNNQRWGFAQQSTVAYTL